MYIEIKGVRIEVADNVDISVDGCVVRAKAKPLFDWRPANASIGTPCPYRIKDDPVAAPHYQALDHLIELLNS